MQILLMNGPNLNMLGKREPEIYGAKTLRDIETECANYAQGLGVSLSSFQSNSECKLIEKIHESVAQIDAIIINPAAFTHTSVAIRDALLSIDAKFVEVHLSNIHKREAFRHHSYFSDIAIGCIVGFGPKGYLLAIDALIEYINTKNN